MGVRKQIIIEAGDEGFSLRLHTLPYTEGSGTLVFFGVDIERIIEEVRAHLDSPQEDVSPIPF